MSQGVSNYEVPNAWREPFLEALRLQPSVTSAARVAQVHRSLPYSAASRDAAFKAAMHDAKHEGGERLEHQLHRWATTGVSTVRTRRKFDRNGNMIEEETIESIERSVTAAIFLLKGIFPDKYGNRIRHTGDGGGGS